MQTWVNKFSAEAKQGAVRIRMEMKLVEGRWPEKQVEVKPTCVAVGLVVQARTRQKLLLQAPQGAGLIYTKLNKYS